MEKIKKHWKEILIAVLVVFGMNKCTSSCSRGNVVKKQTIEIQKKDSIIKYQSDSLNILKIRWNDAQTNQNAYQGLALGNQQELLKQINDLTNEKETLVKKVNSLTSENSKLKKEISKLKQNN